MDSKNINDKDTWQISSVDEFHKLFTEKKIQSAKLLPISDLIKLLQNCDKKLPVLLSNGLLPYSFGSSRCNYDDLAVGSSKKNPYWNYYEDDWACDYENTLCDKPTVQDMLNVLTTCKGYVGYKGGMFGSNMLNGPLWYTEYGCGNQQIISDIKVEQDKVILMIDYFSYWHI